MAECEHRWAIVRLEAEVSGLREQVSRLQSSDSGQRDTIAWQRTEIIALQEWRDRFAERLDALEYAQAADGTEP